jgi:hypothetical protein
MSNSSTSVLTSKKLESKISHSHSNKQEEEDDDIITITETIKLKRIQYEVLKIICDTLGSLYHIIYKRY